MSDDPRCGVVDHQGRVYDATGGGDINPFGEAVVHPNLYVCDGAIYPTAIAANPFFTIAAMAERAAQLMVLHPDNAAYFG